MRMSWLLAAAAVAVPPLAGELTEASAAPCPLGPAAAAVPAVDLGLPLVELCGPLPTEAGPWPTLRWNPVAGAVSYQVAVHTAADAPLWAWTGTATSVVFGGWTDPPPHEVPGLSLTGAAVWFVVAVDAAGVPVAVSPRQLVEP